MNRRDFHRRTASAAALALAAAPFTTRAVAPSTDSPNRFWAEAFDAVAEHHDALEVAFDRPLPEALRGTLWRNGPARMRRGDTRYRHWFDGDGMVHAFRLHGRSLVHQARMVGTDKLRAEAVAGRFLRDGFGTTVAGSLPLSTPDDANVGNIAVLPLVDKATMAVSHRVELPAMAFFHLGNAWRETDTVVLQVMTLGGLQATMEAIRAAMQGRPSRPLRSAMVEVRASLREPRATAQVTPLQSAEFPAWDLRHTGRPTRHLVGVAAGPSLPAGAFGFNAIVRHDRDNGRIDRHDLGAGMLADEHLFVPQPGGAEGEGWVLGTAHDRLAERTVLSVYRAQSLADGPISQAVLPRRLPPGLHGRFQPAPA